MLSVRVAFGDIECTIDYDSDAYSGEIIEDLCRRAAGTVMAMNEVATEQT